MEIDRVAPPPVAPGGSRATRNLHKGVYGIACQHNT
jgi:hypothetical protein